MPQRVVIALGGNAILQPGQAGTLEEQRANISTACQQIAEIVGRGYQVLLSHGNGPQVGNLLLQQEAAKGRVAPMPLDLLGAMSQGQIGYLFQQELGRQLRARQIAKPVLSVVTQVVVAPTDPAFANPTKPVGPFYQEAEAAAMVAAGNGPMAADAGRGWRRVVPSPAPLEIVELEAIRSLVDAGAIVIACGGGGVPVVQSPEGLTGVEAVIDKDLAAQRLAMALGAEVLLLLTGVPKVYLHFGTPKQESLDRITVNEAQRYLAEGHFPAGSMQAKVEGAIQFLQAGGERAIITSLEDAIAALDGKAGTEIATAGSWRPSA